jgi:hypothetical protein
MCVFIDATTGKWCGGCRGGDCQNKWSFRQWFRKVFPAMAEPPLGVTDELLNARHIVAVHNVNGLTAIRFYDGSYFVWDGHYRELDVDEAKSVFYTLI